MQAREIIYLALLKENALERHVPLLAEIQDRSFEGEVASIQLEQLNVQLVTQQPNADTHSFIPLFNLQTVDADGIQLDTNFVAPLLDINDRSLVTQPILEHIVQFNDAIDRCRERLLTEHASAGLDMLKRHRLALLNQLKCMLWRVVEQPLCHPYHLYTECLSALAELSAYGDNPNELMVEPYQHDDLALSLGGLLKNLTNLISQL